MKIIKVPFSAGGLNVTEGCEEAPAKIVEELKEIYLNENRRKVEMNVESVPVNNSNIEETNNDITEFVSHNEEMPIVVGGDHSITYASFRAFAKQFRNPGIIVFDAHPDMVNNFSPPSHEDYLRVLIEEDIVNSNNVVLVGIRNWHRTEDDFLKSRKIKHFSMKELFDEGVKEATDSIMYIARQWDALYISVDIDVLDPAFAPATGHPEPGGLSTRELLYMLQRIKLLNNFKIADLVEINPKLDINNITSRVGARIIAELLPNNTKE